MLSKICSASVIGLDAARIDVECDAGPGQYHCVIVGLPDTSVQEARERVRSAIKNSGLSFPRGRVTVNLAPADIKKQGALYDLPIALSIILADPDLRDVFSEETRTTFARSLCVGELSLEGRVRPVSGVIAISHFAKEQGFDALFVPLTNAQEAALIEGITIYPVATLGTLLDHLTGASLIEPFVGEVDISSPPSSSLFDISYIKGQHHAKRALEIAASGGHNLLFSGAPGSGKTMLARVLPTILPPLSREESLEVARIWSVAGKISSDAPLMIERPFRSPHHSASVPSIVGGGSWPSPGEMTLAHRGVLFLDEFPEFPRSVIEALRQPLEDGYVTVSRVQGTTRFPSRCQLIAAQNPCPCGNKGNPVRECTCSFGDIRLYQKRISGPILDRIDLFVDVPPVEIGHLVAEGGGETSSDVRARVFRARARQEERFASCDIVTNSEIPIQKMEEWCTLTQGAKALLHAACERLHLSARSYGRMRKIARTIADLDGRDEICEDHVSESLQYRPSNQ